ncbi:MAG TPA: hypothetical protein PLD73_08605 [Candidatus Hydrogenedentes bacterium]|jgi:hypothetical protein|nr:hypothetical protein [Candidatus Hydrogenedentota bacterium]HPJ99222.1 hypothetical protein [Candidatus Hydrogenedentota bacterium]
MPCTDVTERIELVLDADDRLISYTLHKRSCGRTTGAEGLLEAVLAGTAAAKIIRMTPDELLERFHPSGGSESSVALRHLFALQAACAVLSGAAPGGPRDLCAAASIAWEEGMTRLTGLIQVNGAHEENRKCGCCQGCISKETALPCTPGHC